MKPLLFVLLCLPALAQDTRAILERAVIDFRAARISESVRGFDEAVRLEPRWMPQLWQRGIAQYYAGQYKECRAQFESHRKVNPADVENAAWHFLCVARMASPDEARKALLPVGHDTREPMSQIYSMFQGKLAPDAVIKAAGRDYSAQFYAYLYTGLYNEALGKAEESLRVMRLAGQAKYAEHGGYMHDVALVHLTLRDAELWSFDRLDRLGTHVTKVQGNPHVIDTPEGKAIEFDGVDDALFVDVHPLAGANAFTWEVIFRPARGGSKEQRFFHLQENGSDNRLLFETRLTGDSWYLDSFALSGKSSKALIRPDRLHPLDQWYRVAMVYDGKTFRNYVNGELEGSADLTLAPQGTGRSSVGVRINLRDYFKGAVKKARFTRRALQPSEFLK